MGVGFVGVDSNARPDVRLAFGDGNDVAPFALPGRNVQESGNAALTSMFEHFRLTFDHAFVIQVTMAVDQPHFAASCASSSCGSSIRGNNGVGCASRNSLSANGEYQWLKMPSNVRSSSATPIASSSRSALRGM